MNFPNLTKKPINQFFPSEVKMVSEGICPSCKDPIEMKDFQDSLSIREYKISGLCQSCQDKIFNMDFDEFLDPDAKG